MKSKLMYGTLTALPLLLVGLVLWDLWGGRRIDVAGQAVTAGVRYGENEKAPEWMPKDWVSSFWSEVHHKSGESIFARDLIEVAGSVLASDWVKSVDRVRRNFAGDMSLGMTVRRPLCLLTREGAQDRYLDDEMVELDVLSSPSSSVQLKNELLPRVKVNDLIGQPPALRSKWLGEMMVFLKEWNSNLGLRERLELRVIEMKPYLAEAAQECRLKLEVKDLKFGATVWIEWGVHRDYNVLENRRSMQKWEDLLSTVEQDRPFSSLDLRYQVPDIGY